MNTPTPDEIIKVRKEAGLTQSQAAQLIYKGLRTWQNWEAPDGDKSHRKMDPAYFEFFKIKAGINNP